MPSNPKIPGAHDRLRIIPIMNFEPGLALFLLERGMEFALKNDSKPITILFRSPGGDMFEAIAAADAIAEVRRVLKAPIIGMVHGYAFSAGSFLLQACDERIITDHSYLMVHGITQGQLHADERHHERNINLLRSLRETVASAYAARSIPTINGRTSMEFWSDAAQDNTPMYFTAREALAHGLVDRIDETSIGKRFGRVVGEDASEASSQTANSMQGVSISRHYRPEQEILQRMREAGERARNAYLSVGEDSNSPKSY